MGLALSTKDRGESDIREIGTRELGGVVANDEHDTTRQQSNGATDHGTAGVLYTGRAWRHCSDTKEGFGTQ